MDSKSTFRVADAVNPPPPMDATICAGSLIKRSAFQGVGKGTRCQKVGYAYLGQDGVDTFMEVAIFLSSRTTYYDRWGGVPRSVLEKTSSHYQEQLEQRSGQVDIDLCLKWIGSDYYNTTEVSGLVFHMSVTAEGDYQDFKVQFASLYVERKVLEYCNQCIHELVTRW